MSSTAIDKLVFDRVRIWIDRLYGAMYAESRPLAMQCCRSKEPVPFNTLRRQKFRPIKAGDVWGTSWDSAWFCMQGRVPADWKGRHVVAVLKFSGEACIMDTDGTPLLGLTSGSVFDAEYIRERYEVTRAARGNETVSLLIEAAANRLGGIARLTDPDPEDPDRNDAWQAVVHRADLAVFRKDIFELIIRADLLKRLVMALPEPGVRRAQLLHALRKAEETWSPDRAGTAAASAILQKELDRKAGDATLKTIAVGHAHIDVAWLWPLRETVRKTGRTFANQLALIKKYPDYIFGASQPHLYQMMKDTYPRLYTQVKKAVKAGRWEPQGGMWVEADCNVPNGESLVRQILYGKLFFEREFGRDVRNIWLPDVFGYSAALPQIAQLAGIDTFFTQKISWSKINKFPYTTFMWKGIDGTRILTHFLPQEGYNSQINPERIPYHLGMVETMENFKEKGFISHYLTTFGVGDGGGGPSDVLIERARLCADLDGMPKVAMGRAESLFRILHKYKDELKEWSGELYLEHHRGTYTSQAENKRMNRVGEQLLREAEFWWSFLDLAGYPRSALYKEWTVLLLNQFHDILPGSSINRVYRESQAQYRQMAASLHDLIARARTRIIAAARTGRAGASLVCFNSLSFTRDDVAVLPAGRLKQGETLLGPDGAPLPVQAIEGGHLVRMQGIAPGVTPLAIVKAQPEPTGELSVTAGKLENSLLRIKLSQTGTITSIYDKEYHRELIPAGAAANQLILCDDRGNAWDLGFVEHPRVLEQAVCLQTRIAERGPVRAAWEQEYRIGNSTIVQHISLAAGERLLRFETRVDWQESEKMLRVRFPLDMINARTRFEIQYGWLERPVHKNTSWERARWEVPGQRYADVSEAEYGAALLNDSKYGYGLAEHMLDLNLLRSSKSPDFFADRGAHLFCYGLMPHGGDLVQSGVQKAAEQFNIPIATERVKGTLDGLRPAVLADDESVRCEIIKAGERENCRIARLYESLGRRRTVALTLAPDVRAVQLTDIMEKKSRTLKMTGKRIRLTFRPFEIKTLKLF